MPSVETAEMLHRPMCANRNLGREALFLTYLLSPRLAKGVLRAAGAQQTFHLGNLRRFFFSFLGES